jgi:hypothetical protein
MPPEDSPIAEAGSEYELRDLSSLRHRRQGMASLMPERADGLVQRIQKKPEKILLLHLSVLEALTCTAVLPDETVWRF